MSETTRSATQLDAVSVEARAGGAAADVWLRKNIVEDAADQGEREGDAIKFWQADELHFVAVGVPSVEEVTANFDELWTAHEDDELSSSERFDKLSQAIEDNTAALIELGDLIGGEE